MLSLQKRRKKTRNMNYYKLKKSYLWKIDMNTEYKEILLVRGVECVAGEDC